jgi:hypothetical protein
LIHAAAILQVVEGCAERRQHSERKPQTPSADDAGQHDAHRRCHEYTVDGGVEEIGQLKTAIRKPTSDAAFDQEPVHVASGGVEAHVGWRLSTHCLDMTDRERS